MKNFILLSFLVLQAVLVFAQEQPRVSQLFNFDWKFRAGDLKEAQLVTYDDDDWRVLDLPHDFQIEQTWDESAGGARGFKAMGTGWYRKHFKANPAWKGKRVLLDFEGIMLVGDVWVNGRKVGSTDYGYLGFETDITDLLKYDEDDKLQVRFNLSNLLLLNKRYEEFEKLYGRWFVSGCSFGHQESHCHCKTWRICLNS